MSGDTGDGGRSSATTPTAAGRRSRRVDDSGRLLRGGRRGEWRSDGGERIPGAGIFIHWGPGAVIYKHGLQRAAPPEGHPGYRQKSYNARHLPVPPEIHDGTYVKYRKAGRAPVEVYDNLYRVFNPTQFDADEWAKVFKESGAGYVIFTSKHIDGFCMFGSAHTDYDVMSSPFKRDICKELAEACREQGLRVLWYYIVSDMYEERYDLSNPKLYEDYLCNHITELLTNYGPIAGVWWDGGSIQLDTERICRLVRRLQPGCIYNGRCWGGRHGVAFASPEQRLGAFNMERPWETCAVIHDSSWIWNGGRNVKSLDMCLRMLIDCAGGDGNLALNFGPTPQGTIHPPIAERYRGMGRWLHSYGESIYKTRGGPYKPGRWGVSTRRGNAVYLHVTQKWPGGVLKLPPLPARVISSRALTGGTPSVLQHGDGLEVRLDASHHASPDTIIGLAIDGDAMAIEPIETLKGHTLTTDARVTASSSANPGSKRGAPQTVVYYSFETGKLAKHFGEETDDDSVEIERRTRSKAKIDVERIRKLIGRNHRGHFWRFWMPEAGDPQPWIEVDLGSPQTFERVAISELYGQVRGYELQRHDAGEWKTFYSGNKIDTLSVHLAEPVTAQRVRLLIKKTNGELPSLTAFDLF
ncbi:MAG: alpha-L-fucosidase [Planctomycetota bacterium]|jgi:alpha-L-fucosidase